MHPKALQRQKQKEHLQRQHDEMINSRIDKALGNGNYEYIISCMKRKETIKTDIWNKIMFCLHLTGHYRFIKYCIATLNNHNRYLKIDIV